jgi:hypothetical protein
VIFWIIYRCGKIEDLGKYLENFKSDFLDNFVINDPLSFQVHQNEKLAWTKNFDKYGLGRNFLVLFPPDGHFSYIIFVRNFPPIYRGGAIWLSGLGNG